jgi:hypothetical protein
MIRNMVDSEAVPDEYMELAESYRSMSVRGEAKGVGDELDEDDEAETKMMEESLQAMSIDDGGSGMWRK